MEMIGMLTCLVGIVLLLECKGMTEEYCPLSKTDSHVLSNACSYPC